MKDAMIKHKISFQLAPPHMHRRNAAEREIRTFRNHFVAGFSTTDPNFPVSEWDRLLDQATITLNLHEGRVNTTFIATKLFLKVRITRSAALQRWMWGGTNWKLILCLVMESFMSLDASLSMMYKVGALLLR